MKGEFMAIVTVGIDLAKNVFAVHGVDATGKPMLIRPSVARAIRRAFVPSILVSPGQPHRAAHFSDSFDLQAPSDMRGQLQML